MGSIIWYPVSTPPDGWLECNGQTTISYPALASVVGATVPDLRGEFIRGWTHDRTGTTDDGRIFRSSQTDQIQNITGTFYGLWAIGGTSGSFASSGTYPSTPITGGSNWREGLINFNASNVVRAGTETRGRNIALLPCIKY